MGTEAARRQEIRYALQFDLRADDVLLKAPNKADSTIKGQENLL